MNLAPDDIMAITSLYGHRNTRPKPPKPSPENTAGTQAPSIVFPPAKEGKEDLCADATIDAIVTTSVSLQYD